LPLFVSVWQLYPTLTLSGTQSLELLVIMSRLPVLLVALLIRSGNSFLSPSIQPVVQRSSLLAVAGADIEQEQEDAPPQVVGNTVVFRGKVNEIDYCIAPADASLSRAYEQSSQDVENPSPNTLSLTRALNNASNRVVRRILLARCWPSEEALNSSLRLAAEAEKQAQKERGASGSAAKCPVPRPILNLLMRRDTSSGNAPSSPKGRTSEQYVMDQILAFRGRYGSLPGYNYAEAYLESVLSLATSGEESPRVKEVMETGIYDESYKRVIAVLKSVGAMLEELPGTDRFRISSNLNDQDICLSMVDKISIQKGSANGIISNGKSGNLNQVETDSEAEASGEKKRGLKFWKKNPLNIILSEDEPSMTRQLNSLSNIVQRALLFGGDQELLVLSETLESNKFPFAERWYPGTGEPAENLEEETRPGLQYLNSLILLLCKAYDDGVVSDLEPAVPLIQSYSNSYERLMGSLVELGSGYIRPMSSSVMTMPKPRTAKEELGRFAVWESNFRSTDGETVSYPEDLVGTWEVRDEVGGETIGVSKVVFEAQGEVAVAPPLQGLRWRLDPGPTHLDTCTFQVLGEDGTVLQYRGFIDRGARLEARFSKRSTKIRGSVMFQMRDGDLALMGEDYWKDMLPINYKTGTTKFVMTKMLTGN